MTTASPQPFDALLPAPRAGVQPSMPTDAACYLRCFPFDPWQMRNLVDALYAFAWTRGYWQPALFVDNGAPSDGAKPRLDALLAAVEARRYRIVFVPGLWVFAINDVSALEVRDRLAGADCEVVELPPRNLQGVRVFG